jgi:hypothetical protein
MEEDVMNFLLKEGYNLWIFEIMKFEKMEEGSGSGIEILEVIRL